MYPINVNFYGKKEDCQLGMENRVPEFTVSGATVELAAEALHCEPCRIAKKPSFQKL